MNHPPPGWWQTGLSPFDAAVIRAAAARAPAATASRLVWLSPEGNGN
jgi:hypothetical protein